jgi:RpiB/LacA/LacB family sugar-phosphate isomerase
MRIAVSSDMDEPVARLLVEELGRRGHTVIPYGALRADDRDDWAWSAEAAAQCLAAGQADQAVVCCWTGTGASIAANKVPGVRAALCADAYTADGARKWNDANALALSLRLTSGPLLTEILDAWFAGAPSADEDDVANVAHLSEIR